MKLALLVLFQYFTIFIDVLINICFPRWSHRACRRRHLVPTPENKRVTLEGGQVGRNPDIFKLLYVSVYTQFDILMISSISSGS